MEYLHNGFTLEICPGAFPLTTDSIALSDFVKLPRSAKVLDLGSGCGTLGVLLCAKDSGCNVTGVEVSANAHKAAQSNAANNNLSARLKSICADMAAVADFITPGSFDVCVSNPPYFSAGPKSQSLPRERSEESCDMDTLFRSAAWSLRYGGDFFLIHRPERLAELFSCACTHKLEPKRLCLLRHKEDGPVSLVMVQCRKGAKPGLIWQEQSLHRADGTPTDYYRCLYHLQEV